VAPVADSDDPAVLLRAVGSELVVGMLIGLLGRLFFSALQTIAVSVSHALGLSAMPGLTIDDDEQLPPIASLFTLTAVTAMFITDQHWLVLSGLVDSYDHIAPEQGFDFRANLVDVVDQLTAVFLLALRIGSPFLIYSIIINFAVGITNKLSPQVPVFFIAMPFVTAGGLLLLAFTVHEFTANFVSAFGVWLARG
jgi:flagellar biosynthetic protein FliR